ncbi:right-handed parallel beta-helix repeat-containing protein, partial [Segetibacter aerophilus]|uniref:right-handed parallel beta-helix repeat-containing protein n=1 Tax=Segetibacter aerophilus TaxID=670293 RepID=UPI0011BF2F49
MKHFLIVAAYLLISFTSRSNSYYFSSTLGSDARTTTEAQKQETPWKSLEKLNSILPVLVAGDMIFFKRGDTFYGSIIIQKSGNSSSPISFGAYGSGNKPVITGFSVPSGWAPAGQNIWETTHPFFSSSINTLLINGTAKRIGRFPNFVNSSEQGFLYYENATGNTAISDSKMSGLNFTGGDVVIRKNRWVLDRNRITNHSGNTLNYASQSGYLADKGYGYFIQNHVKTLDQEGEWYYDRAEKKIGIYTTGGVAALQNVRASTVDVLVSIAEQSNIVFDNIVFTGANTHAFLIKNSSNIRISSCEVLFSGGNAITANNTDHLTIGNSSITHTNNIALNATSCANTTFINNKVSLTGIYAGMGDGDSGSYEALLISGDNNLIEQNVIDSTGYIPVTFSGNNVTIKNNYIRNYAFVKDDGGAIYTWNNGSNPPVNNDRKVIGNIVENGIGAPEGTADKSKKYAHGIYIDDNATNVDVSSNTVANCNGFGLYIHNARDLVIKNNTIYNNEVQLEMQHDDIAPNSPVRNNTVTDNILFSLYATQPVAEYKTKNDDLANFGTFDNNYYCRPIEDNAVINTLKNVNGNYIFNQVDLQGWRAMYGKDANSKKTPKQIASYRINEIIGGNKFSNGLFSADVGGLYSYSPASNFTNRWNNGALDGGTLQLSFSNVAGNNNKGTVIINVGAVTANKAYVLRFSLQGSDENKMLDVYLRKSLSPYTDLTDRKLTKISSSRSEVEFLFVPLESEANASIGIDVPEQTTPVYIDNIQLLNANVTNTNVEDSVRLTYNPAVTTNSFALNTNFIDVKNTVYSGSISLNAFSSVILLNKSTNVATTPISQ